MFSLLVFKTIIQQALRMHFLSYNNRLQELIQPFLKEGFQPRINMGGCSNRISPFKSILIFIKSGFQSLESLHPNVATATDLNIIILVIFLFLPFWTWSVFLLKSCYLNVYFMPIIFRSHMLLQFIFKYSVRKKYEDVVWLTLRQLSTRYQKDIQM